MAEVGKALDSAAASNKPTCVEEEQKTADDTPSTPTTAAAAIAATTSPATPAAAVASIDPALDSDSKTENEASSCARNAKLEELFRSELELYTSGSQVDASPCHAAFEGVFSNPKIQDMDQEPRNDLMLMLMNCVEGETRQPRRRGAEFCFNLEFVVESACLAAPVPATSKK